MILLSAICHLHYNMTPQEGYFLNFADGKSLNSACYKHFTDLSTLGYIAKFQMHCTIGMVCKLYP